MAARGSRTRTRALQAPPVFGGACAHVCHVHVQTGSAASQQQQVRLDRRTSRCEMWKLVVVMR